MQHPNDLEFAVELLNFQRVSSQYRGRRQGVFLKVPDKLIFMHSISDRTISQSCTYLTTGLNPE